jgi:hypothetical protein
MFFSDFLRRSFGAESLLILRLLDDIECVSAFGFKKWLNWSKKSCKLTYNYDSLWLGMNLYSSFRSLRR